MHCKRIHIIDQRLMPEKGSAFLIGENSGSNNISNKPFAKQNEKFIVNLNYYFKKLI